MLEELYTLAPWHHVAGLASPCRAGPCPSHCSLEAQGTGVRQEMAHCTREGSASPHHTELGLQRVGRGGNETQLARKEARKSSPLNRKQGGVLEAELPEEWEGGNLALFARCPQLLSPQQSGARVPQPAGRCLCESSPQALTRGPQGHVRRLCDSLWFAH